MKKSLLTLVLFSVICFGSKAEVTKPIKKTLETAIVEKSKEVVPEDGVYEEYESREAVQETPKERKCPFKRVAYSEVKDGETYLIVKKYVKGENDAEDITPETIVVLKQENDI